MVRAYLHGQDGAQQVQAQALLSLCWKDWLPAWFTYLHDWLREQAGLASTFARAIEEEDGTAISERVIADAHSFVASQRGFAAQLAGQHLVGESVSRFLAKNIDTLSPEVQEVLFPSLDIAADQIRAGNRGTLALVTEASKVIKRDVARDIGQIGNINAGLIEEATSIRDEIGRRLEGFNTSLSAFAREYTAFQNGVKAVDDKLGAFNTRYTSFVRDYASFQDSVTAVDSRISAVETKITAVEDKIGRVNGQLATFDQNLAAFNKDYAGFSTQLGSFNTQFATFSTQLTSFNTQYGTFKQDLATFNSDRAKVGSAITQFNTDLGTFQQNYTSFQTQRLQLTQDIRTLKTDVSTLQVKVNTNINRPT
jgi:peptidoglycan hydrolase CwlO-like protein